MVKRPAAAGRNGVVGTANSESRETSKRRSEMEDCPQAAADRVGVSRTLRTKQRDE
jgi:hypothetical protein